jgi:hypothetical protein
VTFAWPEGRRGFVSVGWLGRAGTRAAMNDAGVSTAEGSTEARTGTVSSREPITPLVRDASESEKDARLAVAEALARLAMPVVGPAPHPPQCRAGAVNQRNDEAGALSAQ